VILIPWYHSVVVLQRYDINEAALWCAWLVLGWVTICKVVRWKVWFNSQSQCAAFSTPKQKRLLQPFELFKVNVSKTVTQFWACSSKTSIYTAAVGPPDDTVSLSWQSAADDDLRQRPADRLISAAVFVLHDAQRTASKQWERANRKNGFAVPAPPIIPAKSRSLISLVGILDIIQPLKNCGLFQSFSGTRIYTIKATNKCCYQSWHKIHVSWHSSNGRRPLGAALHSSNKLDELSQWLHKHCHVYYY